MSTSGSGGCTCNLMNLMKFPCSHFMKVIRHKDLDVYDYCGDSWGKKLCKESCAAFPDTNRSCQIHLIIEHLTAADIKPLLFTISFINLFCIFEKLWAHFCIFEKSWALFCRFRLIVISVLNSNFVFAT